MLRHRIVVPALVAWVVANPAAAAEKYVLRAPGSVGARASNEVGLWKTAAAARQAKSSLAKHQFADLKQLSCEFHPGTPAKVIRREGDVAFVRGQIGLFGGCDGYVRNVFLVKK